MPLILFRDGDGVRIQRIENVKSDVCQKSGLGAGSTPRHESDILTPEQSPANCGTPLRLKGEIQKSLWSPNGLYLALVDKDKGIRIATHPLFYSDRKCETPKEEDWHLVDLLSNAEDNFTLSNGTKNVIPVRYVYWSPKSTYFVASWNIERKAGAQTENDNDKNFIVWRIKTVKSKPECECLVKWNVKRFGGNEWPLIRWNKDEKYCFFLSNCRHIMIFKSSNPSTPPICKIPVESPCNFEIAPLPGSSPDCYRIAAFAPVADSSLLSVFDIDLSATRSPDADLWTKSFQMQNISADSATILWSPSSSALLLLTNKMIDTAGENYDGTVCLFLVRFDGSENPSTQINTKVVQDACWNPQTDEFIMIEGKSPSAIRMLDAFGNVKYSFPSAYRNTIRFDMSGSMIALGGFGTLAGDIGFWYYDHSDGMQFITLWRESFTVHCDWSPGGEYFFTASTYPLMKVDNFAKIFSNDGHLLLHETFSHHLLQVCWQPTSTLPCKIDKPAVQVVTVEKEQVYRSKGVTESSAVAAKYLRGEISEKSHREDMRKKYDKTSRNDKEQKTAKGRIFTKNSAECSDWRSEASRTDVDQANSTSPSFRRNFANSRLNSQKSNSKSPIVSASTSRHISNSSKTSSMSFESKAVDGGSSDKLKPSSLDKAVISALSSAINEAHLDCSNKSNAVPQYAVENNEHGKMLNNESFSHTVVAQQATGFYDNFSPQEVTSGKYVTEVSSPNQMYSKSNLIYSRQSEAQNIQTHHGFDAALGQNISTDVVKRDSNENAKQNNWLCQSESTASDNSFHNHFPPEYTFDSVFHREIHISDKTPLCPTEMNFAQFAGTNQDLNYAHPADSSIPNQIGNAAGNDISRVSVNPDINIAYEQNFASHHNQKQMDHGFASYQNDLQHYNLNHQNPVHASNMPNHGMPIRRGQGETERSALFSLLGQIVGPNTPIRMSVDSPELDPQWQLSDARRSYMPSQESRLNAPVMNDRGLYQNLPPNDEFIAAAQCSPYPGGNRIMTNLDVANSDHMYSNAHYNGFQQLNANVAPSARSGYPDMQNTAVSGTQEYGYPPGLFCQDLPVAGADAVGRYPMDYPFDAAAFMPPVCQHPFQELSNVKESPAFPHSSDNNSGNSFSMASSFGYSEAYKNDPRNSYLSKPNINDDILHNFHDNDQYSRQFIDGGAGEYQWPSSAVQSDFANRRRSGSTAQNVIHNWR